MNVDPKYTKFLTEMEEWGVKDFSNAVPHLQNKFPELTEAEAMAVIKYWNDTKKQLLNE
jgi:hypothetical protein